MRQSSVMRWGAVLAVALTATLPNGIENSALTVSIDHFKFNWILVALAVIPSFIFAVRDITKADAKNIFLILLTVLAAVAVNLANYSSIAATTIAALCYLAIAAGLYYAKYIISRDNKKAKWFAYSIFILCTIQGALTVLTVLVPSLSSLGYLAQGEEHRESFGFYRLGSTLAAANTSGCIVAFSCLALLSIESNQKRRIYIIFATILAILGYQSRSGLVVLGVFGLANIHKIGAIRAIAILLFSGAVFAGLQFTRDADDAESSNAVRVLYAVEALDLQENSSLLANAIGLGPGRGMSRDLSGYYGDEQDTSRNLLSGNESFLLLSLVELGLVGTTIVFFSLYRLLNKRIDLLFALFTYCLLDPSFSRMFEAFMMASLIQMAAIEKKFQFQ